jgi:hypothetical protein
VSERLVLRENTAHDLSDGDRVVAGNFWEREYETADGSKASGLTAQLLFASGRREFVGAGSGLEVDGRRWEVAEVEERGPDGWARLTVVAQDPT